MFKTNTCNACKEAYEYFRSASKMTYSREVTFSVINLDTVDVAPPEYRDVLAQATGVPLFIMHMPGSLIVNLGAGNNIKGRTPGTISESISRVLSQV